MMDANLLRKGEKFDELPETYVVFINEHDVIGKGRPLYHIGRYIFDTNKSFDDGSHILYVNGEYRDETYIGKLMHDFSCTVPDDMYYDELAERVRFFKESKEGISIMCKVMEDMRNQAAIQAAFERAKSVAHRILATGKFSLEEIADMTELSLDEVKKLQTGQSA